MMSFKQTFKEGWLAWVMLSFMVFMCGVFTATLLLLPVYSIYADGGPFTEVGHSDYPFWAALFYVIFVLVIWSAFRYGWSPLRNDLLTNKGAFLTGGAMALCGVVQEPIIIALEPDVVAGFFTPLFCFSAGAIPVFLLPVLKGRPKFAFMFQSAKSASS